MLFLPNSLTVIFFQNGTCLLIDIDIYGSNTGHDPALMFDQSNGCFDLCASFDPFIHKQDACARPECACTQFKGFWLAGVINEFHVVRLHRQLAAFTDWDKSFAKADRHRCTQDKTKRVNPDDQVDFSGVKRGGQVRDKF